MVARADTPDFISTRLREEFSALCAPCLHSHPRPKIRRYHAFIWVRYGAIYGHTFGNFVAVFCWHCSRCWPPRALRWPCPGRSNTSRSEEHTSELQSRGHLVCRLLLEKKKNDIT